MDSLSRRAALGIGLSALLLPGRAFAAEADVVRQAEAIPPYVLLEGHMKPLRFHMQLASTGRMVTAADFRSHPVILYFGFTRCPDTCPLTMQHAARLAARLGGQGRKLRILFVTVDLAYDTIPRLKSFMAQFGPPPVFDALHGTPETLAALAHRYAVMYQAPKGSDAPDPVSGIGHSDATYLFGPDGRAVAIMTALSSLDPKLGQNAALIRKLMA